MSIVFHIGSGAKGYEILDPCHSDDEHDDLIMRLRTLLGRRGHTSGLNLLLAAPFRVHEGTNGFGDDFYLFAATLSVEAYERLRRREAELRGGALQLAEALSDLGNGPRMIVIEAERGAARWSPEGYECDADPIGSGGYAKVFRAAHIGTGKVVALKRPLSAADEEAIARLRREIQEQSKIKHRHVMPILDHADDYSWFTMPLADGNLADERDTIDEDAAITVVEQIAQGLEAAHALGLVHRDVTPRNILRLVDDAGSRWVIADWGMVRRPRGMTSTVRTRPGDPFGTDGFVAPEAMLDAHQATACSDVYSLGRVFGFALTGKIPVANMPQDVPDKWRMLVRILTAPNPARRAQSMTELRSLLARTSTSATQPTPPMAAALLDRIERGQVEAAGELLDLALASPDDDALWLDHVPVLTEESIRYLVREHAEVVAESLGRVEHHVQGSWGSRSYDDLNRPLRWLLRVAECARSVGNDELLEDACRALFDLDPSCDRYAQRTRSRRWLEGLRGDDAERVARVLRHSPDAARFYLQEGWHPTRCEPTIRDALFQAAAEEPKADER